MVRRTGRDRWGLDIFLYDGQTREMLASTSVKHGEKVGILFGKSMRDTSEGDAGLAEATEFINKAMEDDRKQ